MSDIKVKRWVLSRDLNWFTDEMLRMCDGSWFHRAGAEAEKARSPYAVLSSLRGGCSSRIPDDERSERAEVRMVMISWMYCGASPWMALKVVRRILKMILFRTGSQCNWRRTGFMWQRPFTRVTSLAAAFWIRCSLSSSHDGNPKSTELQLSSLEVTNAWTSFSVDAWSRYRRKRPILYRAYDAILHMLLTCWVYTYTDGCPKQVHSRKLCSIQTWYTVVYWHIFWRYSFIKCLSRFWQHFKSLHCLLLCLRCEH